MAYLLALLLAAAANPGPPASAAPAPIATARPEAIATPRDSSGLVLPPVPAVKAAPPEQAGPLSGDIAGANGAFVGLSLSDAVAMALAHNTDLAVSQSNRRIAGFAIVAAQGANDVRFVLQPQYTYEQQAPVSSFQSGPGGAPVQQITAGANAQFSGTTSTGGRFQAGTSATRVNSNLSVNSYDPYYQTAIALQYSQPLLRGLRIDDTRRQIELSRINSDLSSDNALLQASNTTDNVLVAYYNLVAGWRNVGIQEDALRQAQAQAESNGRLVRGGQAAPVEVAESNAQVNEFQDDVFSAIANVASLQNSLKELLLSDPADPMWTANLVPTSSVPSGVAEPNINDVVVAALRNRPEVAQLRENIRQENVNVAYFKDQTRPQVDLNLGVTENGFAGQPTNPNANPFVSVIGAEIAAIDQLIARANATAAPGTPPLVPIGLGGLAVPLFPGTVGNIGTSYKTALEGKFPQYSISATLGFPLHDRTAAANYESELERRQQLQTQEVGLIQRVQAEARNAVQGYRSSRSRLIAASAARAAAQVVAQSELRKFRAGESTTYLVLQRQVTLANERGRELQAQTDVQKALVELDRVSGNILANNHVELQQLGTAAQGATPNLLVPSGNAAGVHP